VVDKRQTVWFLAQLKPNCARIAETNLKRQGFETFLPMEEETRSRGVRFVTTQRPLFPGYMFVGFDIDKGLWRAVNSTHGVTRLVSFGKEPSAVPQELVSQLMLSCDTAGKFLTQPQLKPGDQVQITAGPFASFVAQIETLAPARRVWVLLDFMGGQTRVEVATDLLRKT
jgi:transcriptional antiterminator RfaH